MVKAEDRWRELASCYKKGSPIVGVIDRVNAGGALVTVHPGMGAFLCVIDAKTTLMKDRVVKGKVLSIEMDYCRMMIGEDEKE